MGKSKRSAVNRAGTSQPGAPVVGGERMTALSAAARVLAEAGTAMTCPELVGVMAAEGYWSSPAGKTPAATLSAALHAEIAIKGEAARFRKTAPGRFAATGAPGTLAPGAAGRRKAPGRKRAASPATSTTPPGPAAE